MVTRTFVCLLYGTSFKTFINKTKSIAKHRFRKGENLFFGHTESLSKIFKRARINSPSEFSKHQKSSKLGETLDNLRSHETMDIVLSITVISRIWERLIETVLGIKSTMWGQIRRVWWYTGKEACWGNWKQQRRKSQLADKMAM